MKAIYYLWLSAIKALTSNYFILVNVYAMIPYVGDVPPCSAARRQGSVLSKAVVAARRVDVNLSWDQTDPHSVKNDLPASAAQVSSV